MSSDQRVLLVEDEASTREHFAAVVRSCEGIAVVHAVETIAAATKALRDRQFDLLLTDLDLPDGNGLDLIRQMRVSQPRVQILVISVFGDERNVVESVLAGAHGYLLKDGSPSELQRALCDLIRGGSPLSPAVARYVLKLVQAPPRMPHALLASGSGRLPAPRLSKREIDVLELLARGFSPSEIAELWKISPHTVITHTRSIHRKLEVNSRAEAVFEAVSLGLLRL